MPRITMAPIQRRVTWWNWRQSRPAGCSSTPVRASGKELRPCILCSSLSSSCSLTDCAVGLTEVGCWAVAGQLTATARHKMSAPIADLNTRLMRAIANSLCLTFWSRFELRFGRARRLVALRGDGFPISGLPAPRPRRVAALDHAFLIDLGDDLAIAGQQ